MVRLSGLLDKKKKTTVSALATDPNANLLHKWRSY